MSDPLVAAKLSPSIRPSEGEMLPCEIAGEAFIVSRIEGNYVAIRDLCTHAEQKLSEGRMRGSTIYCPLHGARFDLRDGKCLAGPATRDVDAYGVLEEGDDLVLGERRKSPSA